MIYSLEGVMPQVSSNVFIAPGSSVVGNVEIAEKASIWFGVVIRGDNDLMYIGEGTNIQDNSVLHSDPGFPLKIGRNCTIGHSAIVHGCTIGDGTLIGMGANILNGANIGENCLIGAGALVTENTIIPDNSLAVGSPARVKRELSKEQIESLQQSALLYQANSKRFAKGLSG